MNKRAVVISLLVFTILLVSTWVYFRIRIGADMDTVISKATVEYGDDPVEALISFVGSADHSLAEKNNAIWALGKLKDDRALPVLHGLETGKECDHARYVCQRTLLTAIETIDGSRPDIMAFRQKAKVHKN